MIAAEKPRLGTTCTDIGSPVWQVSVGWVTLMLSKPTTALFTIDSMIKRTLSFWLNPISSSKVTSPSFQLSDCVAAGKVLTKRVAPPPDGFSTSKITLSGTLEADRWFFPKLMYLSFTVMVRNLTTFSMSFTYN